MKRLISALSLVFLFTVSSFAEINLQSNTENVVNECFYNSAVRGAEYMGSAPVANGNTYCYYEFWELPNLSWIRFKITCSIPVLDYTKEHGFFMLYTVQQIHMGIAKMIEIKRL